MAHSSRCRTLVGVLLGAAAVVMTGAAYASSGDSSGGSDGPIGQLVPRYCQNCEIGTTINCAANEDADCVNNQATGRKDKCGCVSQTQT